MLKTITLFASIIFFCSVQRITAQIDWKAYTEPDGTFKRWSFQPNFAFENQDIEDNFKTNLSLENSSFYQSIKVRELSISRLFINASFILREMLT